MMSMLAFASARRPNVPPLRRPMMSGLARLARSPSRAPTTPRCLSDWRYAALSCLTSPLLRPSQRKNDVPSLPMVQEMAFFAQPPIAPPIVREVASLQLSASRMRSSSVAYVRVVKYDASAPAEAWALAPAMDDSLPATAESLASAPPAKRNVTLIGRPLPGALISPMSLTRTPARSPAVAALGMPRPMSAPTPAENSTLREPPFSASDPTIPRSVEAVASASWKSRIWSLVRCESSSASPMTFPNSAVFGGVAGTAVGSTAERCSRKVARRLENFASRRSISARSAVVTWCFTPKVKKFWIVRSDFSLKPIRPLSLPCSASAFCVS